ncbi:MAG: hypothetical protein KIT46_02075 [Anaerolineales bacterium]|nr:hypothetical protein [Anaerolineales bacterium]MCW5854813.1 hypothetical protein [Anaerolineales bacterium]
MPAVIYMARVGLIVARMVLPLGVMFLLAVSMMRVRMRIMDMHMMRMIFGIVLGLVHGSRSGYWWLNSC